jgi:hypothetical protein
MGLIMTDVEIIRAVRCLCIQHKFAEAQTLARKVDDTPSRETLILICKSFEQSQIKVRAA